MKNKNVGKMVANGLLALIYLAEMIILCLLSYWYFKQYMGCTMTAGVSTICQAGDFILLCFVCLDIFLGYLSFLSSHKKLTYALWLVIFLGSQIMFLASVSHANI